MASKILDVYKKYLKYNDDIVYIAFDTITSKPYFHAKQVCKLLKYSNTKFALKNNVNEDDIYYLKDIVKNYKLLYKNVQGNTKFLTESGFLKLILRRGDNDLINDIFDWITEDVIPSIRQFGEYKATSNLKKQLDELNELLAEKDEKIQILENNLKKDKHEIGGMVYIMRPIIDKISLDLDEEMYIKFGTTEDMNKRENNYNTCVPNKVQIIKKVYVDDAFTIEKCVIKKMSKYKIKNKKEYFKCSYNQMIDAIHACVLCYENKNIDKNPEININIKRQENKNDFFDENRTMIMKIIGTEYECEFEDKNKNKKKPKGGFFDSDSSSELTSDYVIDSDLDTDTYFDSESYSTITSGILSDTVSYIYSDEKKSQTGGEMTISYKEKFERMEKLYYELLFDLM
jgi:prophage antirepressor-like protein